jgi:hypothetical protein
MCLETSRVNTCNGTGKDSLIGKYPNQLRLNQDALPLYRIAIATLM